MDIEITAFDGERAEEADLLAYHRVVQSARDVDLAEAVPIAYEAVVRSVRLPHPGLGRADRWVARRSGEVIAVAFAYFPDGGNEHVALVDVTVHPKARRQGIGTALLEAVLPGLRGRRVVEGLQVVAGGAGERWAHALGFRTVNATVMQELRIADVDAARWDVDVPEGYRLETWSGAAPDHVVESYVRSKAAMHDAPTGSAAFHHPEWTVERVRRTEEELRRSGRDHRVVVAVHEATGEVAGFTELRLPVPPNREAVQQDTGVHAEHRGHGLGLCVKARMLRDLVADDLAVDSVITSTNADNEHMVAVNLALGYTTIRSMVDVNRTAAPD
ncbi:GNAT family N-acetyltransferase [Umezawaea tangerina]|uniref:RimJ/RimL family protein N-acetyltransferase n=1 Tax=Umezawaea tangerina TaxID=84725 RepID=A0A2T0T3X6_9PSEU|nr:GNAT family N-acetyltransferase [Umezawaea tangerina]PRY40367.1 RimJ/RimL family protein N-acetyltransferase [Umezawaea tangerina]